ncbi:hypothetical protein [Planifilum fimeticola]|uniref:hypothetical protein n=1 Tax=Planifilum fimeticola TaxID=201975 RepID=UPI0011B1CC0C|nr:hypothetical protein [Planifilum fimeticola]
MKMVFKFKDGTAIVQEAPKTFEEISLFFSELDSKNTEDGRIYAGDIEKKFKDLFSIEVIMD